MKEYTLPEALKYLAENPGKELIDEDGDRVRLWIYENSKKITFQWFIPAQDCWADIEAVEGPFRHPEPKPEPVTLPTLWRFKRVTVEWPEWVAVSQKKGKFFIRHLWEGVDTLLNRAYRPRPPHGPERDRGGGVMKPNTIIEVNGRGRATVVYHHLDGYGIVWGEHEFSEDTLPAPEAMLRTPYRTDIECVGGAYRIIKEGKYFD